MSSIHHPIQIRPMPHRIAGFSLVEIMVGMVIGLLGIIIMMNLFSNFEAQKRTTSGGSDVQNEAAISLFSIQRDIMQAGYDINSQNLLGCSVSVPLPPAPNPTFPTVAFTLPAIAPVTINPASSVVPVGDLNTDTLLVVYGNGNGQPEGDIISSLGVGGAVATTFNVKYQPPSAQLGDQVIFEPVTRPTPCNLSVDSVVGVNSTSVNLNSGMASASIPIVPSNIGTLFHLGNLMNGNKLIVNGYAIRNGSLTVCNFMENDCSNPAAAVINTAWLPIANGIVSLKAEYGRDDTTINPPPMTGIVNVYDQNTPSPASVSYACDWMRISTVRIALVGRNGQPDKSIVTSAAPTWADSAGNPINLTGTANWQNYRYKVFETTVPIRNISIKGVVTGC